PGGLCRLRHHARSRPCHGEAGPLAASGQAGPHGASLSLFRSSLWSEHPLFGSCVPFPLEDSEGGIDPPPDPPPGERVMAGKPALEAGHRAVNGAVRCERPASYSDSPLGLRRPHQSPRLIDTRFAPLSSIPPHGPLALA